MACNSPAGVRDEGSVLRLARCPPTCVVPTHSVIGNPFLHVAVLFFLFSLKVLSFQFSSFAEVQWCASKAQDVMFAIDVPCGVIPPSRPLPRLSPRRGACCGCWEPEGPPSRPPT